MRTSLRLKNLLVLLLVLFVKNSCAQSVLSKKQWLEDLDVLEKAVYEKHINPFWKNPQITFQNKVSSLKAKLNGTEESQLSPETIMTGFAQILALTADGHSGVSTKSRADLFGLYTYNVSWFPEGLFITRTSENNRDILGKKVIKIDDTPIEDAKKQIITVSTSFHEYGFRRFSARYFESPGVLYGLGISKSPQQVTLTLQDEAGAISTVAFQRINLKEQEKTKYISLNDIATQPLPLYRRNLGKNYWFEYLPEKKALYLNYISVQNSKEESMQDFVMRLSKSIEQEEVEKFVVDLRYNAGGDQFTALPLLSFIMNNSKINQPGNLFVITGSNTFSAATAFLEALETKTNCIIAGIPTSDSPMYPAEDKTTVLPNCKMEVRLSNEMWSYSIDDDWRNIIEPDINVVTGVKDYIGGVDPVLAAIADYQHNDKKSIVVNPEKYVGRYLFGIDKALEIININGVLKADIKGRLHTTLYPTASNSFETEIKGLVLEFNKDEILIHYPDGKEKKLKKLSPDELTAFDFLLRKQFDKAEQAYFKLRQKYPDAVAINGTNLAGLAFYLFVETNDLEISKALLDIALKIDPRSQVAKNLAKAAAALAK